MNAVSERNLDMARAMSSQMAWKFPGHQLDGDFFSAAWIALAQRKDGEVSPHLTILRAIHGVIRSHLPPPLKRGVRVVPRLVPLDFIPEPYDFEDGFRRVDWSDQRRSWLGRFPDSEAAVLLTMFGEEDYLNQKQAARKLGLSPASVSRTYRKAISTLRNRTPED